MQGQSYSNTDAAARSLIESRCLRTDLRTYDPYDMWKEKAGLQVRRLYFSQRWLGSLPAAAMTLFDTFINNRLRLGYSPQEYPIVRAMASLALLALQDIEATTEGRSAIEGHGRWLIENQAEGASGAAWGIAFPWVSKHASYSAGVPHVTHTPYPLELLVEMRQRYGDTSLDPVIRSVFDFFDSDIPCLIDEPERMATAYSPVAESRIVTNASSYAMYSYALLRDFRPDKAELICSRIKRLHAFVASQQREDGSFTYYADHEPGNFIDCFHSCIVLKNLIKTHAIEPLPGSTEIIERGYQFIQQRLRDRQSGLYRRFAIQDIPSLTRFDLYDNAEMLNLMLLMNQHEEALDLAKAIGKKFVVGGAIYSQIDLIGRRRNRDFLRWAAMPYLYALARLLRANHLRAIAE